ncbi:hypothetical protein G6F60_015426 [Rhizopus arrhizus]|nr:hypothetical protein G6F60_015426 [Rhizopus arrhizus]
MRGYLPAMQRPAVGAVRGQQFVDHRVIQRRRCVQRDIQAAHALPRGVDRGHGRRIGQYPRARARAHSELRLP